VNLRNYCNARSSALSKFTLATSLMLPLLTAGLFAGKAAAQTDVNVLASLAPYSVTQRAYLTSTCSGSYCTMKFPPVPAGKRLLVASISFNTFSSTNTLSAVLTNGLNYTVTGYKAINLPGAVVAKNDNSGFGYQLSYSGLTVFYLEAGEVPTINYTGSVLTNDYAGIATISGVLVPTK
jgi:hypothetical protein